jgi:hypothetical protein
VPDLDKFLNPDSSIPDLILGGVSILSLIFKPLTIHSSKFFLPFFGSIYLASKTIEMAYSVDRKY